MCHFPRASPRSISTLLNMVSFSLFLSHLYMTLILFITPRQYYSPQLLQGFSAEDFTLSLISPLPWVLHSPQLFRGGFSHHFLLSTGSSHIFPWLFFSKSQFYMDCMGGFYIQGLSAEEFLWALTGFLFYTLVYLCHISPGHIRGGLQPPDCPLFPTFFIIRSMSAEGISIIRMVKITQSCSIFNSPRYNPLVPKTYYNNPVFFLSEAYPRRI